MQQQNQGQRKPQPVKIALEIEEPKKIDDTYSVLCSAIISQGNRTLDGMNVQFFLNGLPYKGSTQTDGNGRVQTQIKDISISNKEISIEAQIAGQQARARKIIALPMAEKKNENVRIVIEKSIDDDEKTMVLVSKKDAGGKMVLGKIICIDDMEDLLLKVGKADKFNLTNKLKTLSLPVNKSGMALVSFKKKDKERRALLLPEENSPESTWTSVDIGAKKVTSTDQPQKPKKVLSFAEKFIVAINLGRQMAYEKIQERTV